MSAATVLVDVEKINDIFFARSRDKQGFDSLVDSISRIGLIIPITVQKKDDQYQLIKGQGRLEAYKELKLPKIKAFVLDQEVAEKKKIENWLVENAVRQHLSLF